MIKKRILLLGGSGSVGSQTLDVILQHPELFELTGLSVGKNIDFLKDYLQKYPLAYGCVADAKMAELLQQQFPKTIFYAGEQGLETLASLEEYDVLFNALQGFVGLMPTICAILHHHDVACANKESLVAAGNMVMSLAKENHVHIIPVDSEHSAIFQTLQGYDYGDIKKLIITASGGAFKNKSREEIKNATLQDTLNHPNWNMGAKITIDSATMMNKGFEVIEAHVLFGVPYSQIDVILHPESIIHSLTEFKDHTVLAQLGVPDMRIPCQYSLTYPKRYSNLSQELSLADLGSLTFKHMDYQRFPLLDLAYACGVMDGNMPAILNGANEAAVKLFIDGKITFLQIEELIFATVFAGKDIYLPNPTLPQIIQANQWAVDQVTLLAKDL